MLERGDQAPDFTVLSHHGRPVSLTDFRGRKLLIWFFPEASTPACTTEGISFRDQRSYFDENNVALVGASFNTVEDNAAFAATHTFDFPLLCDIDHSLALAYGACADVKARYAERISVLIDEQGHIMRIYRNVDPRDHAAQVLVDLIESE